MGFPGKIIYGGWMFVALNNICVGPVGVSDVKDLHGIPSTDSMEDAWLIPILNHPVHYIIYITHLFDLCK